MSVVKIVPQDLRPFFSPKALASYLSVSERTVRDMLSKGRLPSYKIEGQRRVAPADVDIWQEQEAIAQAWRDAQPPRERAPRKSVGHYGTVLLCDPCSYCGGVAEHVDHIVALSRGGADDWTNYTAACAGCNLSKHTGPALVWMATR